MDYGKKNIIFFSLCAFVGTARLLEIKTNLEIMISVPPTHVGDTEIGSAVFSSSPGHPFMYTVVAQKNQTRCINSTDPLCSSLIKAPAVNVSVTSTSSNGKNFTYFCFVNGSRRVVIHVGPEVSVTPQIVEGEGDNITVILDITYNEANTTGHTYSPRSSRRPALFGFGVHFVTGTTTIIEERNGPWYGQQNPYRYRPINGQSALGCAPVGALVLLALTPFYFSSD
ncbi:uncharacterized protein LOC130291694 [Hyla sarda]|uniref:uncharacterized protein LOC130291694 n=1 Tax=Hyla sarda TaxID=327740 RepID=UPI0024C444F7|nr:uncharacterized protein LOC130291694 [Hyla sarda]XP_056396787.1 uncharacterized protein LOC130291694 [Hyla sarda]XP_056396788.1 uncharacterized protein LOC130291694 [Hyla sarda]XP_056396789.1 uncharacterized protein LOC130291694 [Hyla sarda]